MTSRFPAKRRQAWKSYNPKFYDGFDLEGPGDQSLFKKHRR
jgi:hypothetical protein